MKIHSVKLRNINSLQTDDIIELNFLKTPLADTGLFAIVGDTGAGKTSILDAITLGMYGKVHRNKNEKEVMSYGTTDSLAEVEFEANQQLYRSKWNIRRARSKVDGNIQPARRELSQWNAEKQQFDIIYERIHGYNEQMQELTGLDYHQFCRSVLLAQGDFAAFLKAESKERSELLERITGTEYYTKISQAAYERHDIEEQALQKLRDQLASLDLLPEEELQALQQQLQEKTKESTATQQTLKLLQTQVQWLETCQQLEIRQQQLSLQKEEIETRIQAKNSDFQRLEQQEKVLPFKADCDQLKRLKQQRKELHSKIERGTINVETLTKDKSQQIISLEKQLKTLEQLKKERKEKEVILRATETADLQIEETKKQLNQLQEEQKGASTKQTAQTEELELIQSIQEKLQTTVKELEEWLGKHQFLVPAEKDLAQLELYQERISNLQQSIQEIEQEQLRYETQLLAQEKKLKLAQQQVKNATDLLADDEKAFALYAPRHYKLEFKTRANWMKKMNEQVQHMKLYFSTLENLIVTVQQIEDQEQLLRSQQENLSITEEQLLVSNKRLEELKTEVRAKKRHYELERAVKDYERDRSELEEGEACPLCGSKSHPFCEGEWSSDYIDEAKLLLEKAEEALKKEQTYWNNLGLNQKSSEAKIEIFKQDIERLQKQIEPLQKEIEVTAISDRPIDFSYVELKKTIANYRKHLKEEEKRHAAVQELDFRMQIQENKKVAAQEQTLKLNQEFQDFNTQFKSQQNQLKNWKKELAINLEAADKLIEKYPLENTKNPVAKLRELHHMFLLKESELGQQSQKYKSTIQQISFTAQQLEERSIHLQKRQEGIHSQTKRLQQIQEKRIALFEGKDPKIARQTLLEKLENNEQQTQNSQSTFNQLSQDLVAASTALQSQQEQLEGVRKEGKILQEKLKESLSKLNLEIKDLEELWLPEEEALSIKQTKEQLYNQQQEIALMWKETAQQLQKEQIKAMTSETADQLNIQQKEITETYEKCQQEVGALKERLQYNESRKAQSKSLQIALSKQKKEYARWKQLNDLIGMRSGKKFRVFAQGLTLQQLVYHANQHLEKLNDRYFIQRHESEELELEIIDLYQANHIRSMNTLSGGESFLVSLALALGLSDLAGKNALIRSLFIDEGFGTLDEATLDMAITTLENLQASGKTIGVISHVQALKERISTQIRVNKQGNGYSVVEIVN